MRRLVRLALRAARSLGLLRDGDLRSGRHHAVLAEVHRLGVRASARVLDVGCGDGSLLSAFSQAGFADLHGCDWVPTARSGSASLTVADLNTDSLASIYGDGFADLVICSDVIEHLENPSAVLRGIAAVMKPGGRAILTVPNTSNIFERLFFLATGDSSRFQPGRFGPHGHITMTTPLILEHLVERAGLSVLRVGGDLAAVAGSVIPGLRPTPRWSYSLVLTIRAA